MELQIVMPHDKNGKPRGYAFIEFSHKSEMSGMLFVWFAPSPDNPSQQLAENSSKIIP